MYRLRSENATFCFYPVRITMYIHTYELSSGRINLKASEKVYIFSLIAGRLLYAKPFTDLAVEAIRFPRVCGGTSDRFNLNLINHMWDDYVSLPGLLSHVRVRRDQRGFPETDEFEH